MNIKVHSIYDRFFPTIGTTAGSWEQFKSYKVERLEPDLAISTVERAGYWEVAAKVMRLLIFPGFLYLGMKYILERITMYHLYAAQRYSKSHVNALRELIAQKFNLSANKDLIGREVTLQKDGVCYSGLLVGHSRSIANGKWALYAPGRDTTIEHAYLNGCAEPFLGAGYSVLMINGPNAGRSSGTASPDTLGEAQGLGITFLETALKAKKIIISGHSLGAASISKAIKTHTFKDGINYLVIRIMTFCKLSNIARKMAGAMAFKMVHWLGYEINQVEVSNILRRQRISEIVFEGGRDDIMDGARLGAGLARKNLTEGKVIHIPDAEHTDLPFTLIQREIQSWDVTLLTPS